MKEESEDGKKRRRRGTGRGRKTWVMNLLKMVTQLRCHREAWQQEEERELEKMLCPSYSFIFKRCITLFNISHTHASFTLTQERSRNISFLNNINSQNEEGVS